MKRARNVSLDVISGILIIYMVFYHILLSAGFSNTNLMKFYVVVFSFFMPWFFFKGGMFFYHKKINNIISKSLKRLVYPFVIFSFIGYIVNCIYLYFVEMDKNIIHYTLSPIKQLLAYGSIEGNLPLWFLLSLFAVRIIFYYTYQHKYLLLLLVSIPYIAHIFNFSTPYYLVNTFSGLFFYACGYYLKEKQYNSYIVIISLAIYILCGILSPTYIDMRTNNVVYGSYTLYYIISLAGIISLNGIFHKFMANDIFAKIGKNSMRILCLHYIIITLVKMCFPCVKSFSFLILSSCAMLVIVPTICIYLDKSKFRNFI